MSRNLSNLGFAYTDREIDRLEQIEQAIISLTDDDFRKLYHWMLELDHQK